MARRETQYPAQISALVEQETYDRIEREADESGLGKGEIVRTYLAAGMRTADDAYAVAVAPGFSAAALQLAPVATE